MENSVSPRNLWFRKICKLVFIQHFEPKKEKKILVDILVDKWHYKKTLISSAQKK